MTFRTLTQHKYFRPGIGAILSALCGLALWATSLGDNWIGASFDSLYRFGTHQSGKDVMLILMDDDSFDQLKQSRSGIWNRSLHTELLSKLADDGCPLVVFDVFFKQADTNAETDRALAAAMRRLSNVVLCARIEAHEHGDFSDARDLLPYELFREAARTNWGVAFLVPDNDHVVRKHWPFPNPDSHQSLTCAAAGIHGTQLDPEPEERWIRYYGRTGTIPWMSYYLAKKQPPGYFKNKTVFIGLKPRNALASSADDDKFLTSYGEDAGGVEILATCYLNLTKGDWLRRPDKILEGSMFALFGLAFGGGICLLRWTRALGLSVAAVLLVTIGTACAFHYANYWFPWLIVVGAQIPAPLILSLYNHSKDTDSPKQPNKKKTIVLHFPDELTPAIPNYTLINPPFGEGGFGKVWLARSALGQWQAIKVVYRSNFGDAKSYEIEFNGLRRYKPVSEEHAGLLRVELVSEQRPEGYFYYVMELGDSKIPGWENEPTLFKPKDLESIRQSFPGQRIPVRECLRISLALLETLAFLHEKNLIHRDIKPSNVIFVKDRPKLADIGLVSEVRPVGQVKTIIGTPGYMPPKEDEPPGTVQADIYAMGMLIYVISTGNNPEAFPKLRASLLANSANSDFLLLNPIILKACQRDIADRYQNARELLLDLKKASDQLDGR